MAVADSVITAWFTRLLEFLRRDYVRNQTTLEFAKYVGWWAHPLYYLIWTVILPQPYESAWLRFASGIGFIPFLFYKHYPVHFGPWLNLYWYLWLTFTLPVIFTFPLLMNDLSGMWLVCQTMMFLVFAIFVSNFFFMMSLLVAGMSIEYLSFVWTTDSHLPLTTKIIEYMIPIPMAMLCAILFTLTKRQGEVALERNQALQSLGWRYCPRDAQSAGAGAAHPEYHPSINSPSTIPAGRSSPGTNRRSTRSTKGLPTARWP